MFQATCNATATASLVVRGVVCDLVVVYKEQYCT